MKTNCLNAANNVVQVVYNSVTSPVPLPGATPNDDTIPQQTEGTEALTCTITPHNANNILEIRFVGNFANPQPIITTTALFQDATADALTATGQAHTHTGTSYLHHFMTAGTTSATTFKIRMGYGSGSGQNNLNASEDVSVTRLFGGSSISSITIFEYSV